MATVNKQRYKVLTKLRGSFQKCQVIRKDEIVEIFLENSGKLMSDPRYADLLLGLLEEICTIQPKVETVSPFI
jgi:hypothetical protein